VNRTAFLALLLPAVAACSYGPVVDQSGLRSAVVTPNEQTIGLAYQVLRYRPAEGVAAFPDGGVPHYLDDRIVIAVVPVAGGAPRVLQRLSNAGVSGSGSVTLRTYDADPDHLLVLFSEQSSTAAPSRLRLWRLAVADGRVTPYPDLAADLRAKARRLGSKEFGDVRVIDPDGTLLIGVEGPAGDELWIRSAAGEYRLVDPLKHFYGIRDAELYYWSGDEARVTNWRTGQVRVIARYDPAIRQTSTLIPRDPTVTAIEAAPAKHSSVAWEGGDIRLTGLDGTERHVPVDLDKLRR